MAGAIGAVAAVSTVTHLGPLAANAGTRSTVTAGRRDVDVKERSLRVLGGCVLEFFAMGW
jgi:hypothetical protein